MLDRLSFLKLPTLVILKCYIFTNGLNANNSHSSTLTFMCFQTSSIQYVALLISIQGSFEYSGKGISSYSIYSVCVYIKFRTGEIRVHGVTLSEILFLIPVNQSSRNLKSPNRNQYSGWRGLSIVRPLNFKSHFYQSKQYETIKTESTCSSYPLTSFNHVNRQETFQREHRKLEMQSL
jgi:hypothetical protein